MAVNVVLDTNAVLYFLAGRLTESLPSATFYISIITEIELLSYPLLHTEEEMDIHEFLKDVTVVDLNQAIKEAAIKLRRQYRLKLPDAIITATTLYLEAELFSNDVKLANVTEISVSALVLKVE